MQQQQLDGLDVDELKAKIEETTTNQVQTEEMTANQVQMLTSDSPTAMLFDLQRRRTVADHTLDAEVQQFVLCRCSARTCTRVPASV